MRFVEGIASLLLVLVMLAPCRAFAAAPQRFRLQFAAVSAFQARFVYSAFQSGGGGRVALSIAFRGRIASVENIRYGRQRLFSSTADEASVLQSDPRIPASSFDSPSSSSASDDGGEIAAPTIVVPRKFRPKPFQYHEIVTIRIESLTNMGWGIGRVKIEEEETKEGEENSGDSDEKRRDRLWVVMVPHVVVGELVNARIFRNMKSYSEADLVEVIESSNQRVTPKCELAGVCGGCQYQHMSIQAQREWKTEHVHEVLRQQSITGYTETEENNERLAKDLLKPTLGTEHVYHYRSKLTPHYQAPREVSESQFEMEAIGFQQSSNRNLVDVPRCPIATDAINDVYIQTRKKLLEDATAGLLNSKTNPALKKRKGRKRGSRGGDTGATLLFRHADDDENGQPVVVTNNNQYMTTTVRGIKFRYQAGNFFQNNNYVLPLMVEAVLDAATAPLPNGNGKPKYLIDCYCGSGLFAVSAASSMTACIGIELNERAIQEATMNAELNEIDNCQFVAASAEAIFTSPPKLANDAFTSRGIDRVQDLPRDETVVVLDPPRKGCSEAFLEQLYAYQPQRIVYMSCGPATQARDAKGIVEVGGYEITSIQPFDLFPQTKHIENLMIFEKKRN